MPPDTDRRRFWRAAFHAPASLGSAGASWQVEVCDLSLKGALLDMQMPDQVGPGQSVELTLPLSEDVSIAMRGRIAHVAGRRVGLACEHIDLDSITHLRRLVELNLGDPAELERELASLGR